MGDAERLAYIDLLMLCHRLGKVPSDPKRLARLLGTRPGVIVDMFEWVADEFDIDGDTMTHSFVEEQRADAAATSAKRSAAGRRGNDTRWVANAIQKGGKCDTPEGRNCDTKGSPANSDCNSLGLGGMGGTGLGAVGGTGGAAAAAPAAAADEFWGELAPGYRAELGGADE